MAKSASRLMRLKGYNNDWYGTDLAEILATPFVMCK
jgi:hypothetical protein